MDAISAAYDGDVQMIDNTSIRPHQQAATLKRGVEIIVSVAPGTDRDRPDEDGCMHFLREFEELQGGRDD